MKYPLFKVHINEDSALYELKNVLTSGFLIEFTSRIIKETGLDIIHFGNSGWNLKENYCINYSNYKK